MAAMMILMIVFLAAPSAGGHMGTHGANASSSQTAPSNEHGMATPENERGTAKPESTNP